MQPNDRIESIFGVATLKSIPKDADLNAISFPIDLVVSRELSGDEKMCTKRKRTRTKDSLEVICLDDSSSDDEEQLDSKENRSTTDDVPEVSVPDVSDVSVAKPDPHLTFREDDWVLTSMGPGRVLSSSMARYAQPPFLCSPLIVYVVQLELGRIYCTQVESLIQSEYGQEVVVQEPRIIKYDLVRLWPRVYLNGSLVAFYIRYLQQTFATDNMHIYSTYLYTKMTLITRMTREALWESLQRWTKNVDIWEKHLLLIPINDKLHWSLAVVVNPGGLRSERKLIISTPSRLGKTLSTTSIGDIVREIA